MPEAFLPHWRFLSLALKAVLDFIEDYATLIAAKLVYHHAAETVVWQWVVTGQVATLVYPHNHSWETRGQTHHLAYR